MIIVESYYRRKPVPRDVLVNSYSYERKFEKHLLKGKVLKSIMEGNITALDIQTDIGYDNINTLCKELYYLNKHNYLTKIDFMGKLHYSLTDKGLQHAHNPYFACQHNSAVMGSLGNGNVSNRSELVVDSTPQPLNQEVIPIIPETPSEPFKTILNNPLKNVNVNIMMVNEVKDIQPFYRRRPGVKDVKVKGHKRNVKKPILLISE